MEVRVINLKLNNMNMNRVYNRLSAEINNEQHLTETEKVMFKAIVLQVFADEQKLEWDEFLIEQKKFNESLEKSCTNIELISNLTKN